MFLSRNMGSGSVGFLCLFVALLFVHAVVGQIQTPPQIPTTSNTPPTTVPTTTQDPFLPCSTAGNDTDLTFIFNNCQGAPLIDGSFVFDVSQEPDGSRINTFFGSFMGSIAVDFRMENNNNTVSLDLGKAIFQKHLIIVNNEALEELKGNPNIAGSLVVRGNRHIKEKSIKNVGKWVSDQSGIQKFGECTQSPLNPLDFTKCKHIYGDLDLTDFSQSQDFHPETVSGCLRMHRDSGEYLDIPGFLSEFLKNKNQTEDCKKTSVIEGYCIKITDQNKIKAAFAEENIVFKNSKACQFNCTEEDYKLGEKDCIVERVASLVPANSDLDEISSIILARNKKKKLKKSVQCSIPHKDCDIFLGTLMINRVNNVSNLDFQNIHTIYGRITIFGSSKSTIHFTSLKRIIGKAPLIQVMKNKYIEELTFPVLEELRPTSESGQTVVSIADNFSVSVYMFRQMEYLSQGRFTIDGMTSAQYLTMHDPDAHPSEFLWWILVWGFVFFFGLASMELQKLYFVFQIDRLKTEDVVRSTIMQEYTMQAKLERHSRLHHYLGKKEGMRWAGVVEWSPKRHKYKQSPWPTSCWVKYYESARMSPAWKHLSNFFSKSYRDIELPDRNQTAIDKAYAKRVMEKAQSIHSAAAGVGYGTQHNYIVERKRMINDVKERMAAYNEPEVEEYVGPFIERNVVDNEKYQLMNTEEKAAYELKQIPLPLQDTQESVGKTGKRKIQKKRTTRKK